jgi:hypothetical protein
MLPGAVPSPIMATCQGFAWSSLTNEEGRSRLGIEVTLKSFWAQSLNTSRRAAAANPPWTHCVEPIEIITADGFRKHGTLLSKHEIVQNALDLLTMVNADPDGS